ncbi:MAG TPA: MFS transporter [Beutenbergiaceae bacterium]|nr:MFS transporter [Beutenbergiaceae bacterium]
MSAVSEEAPIKRQERALLAVVYLSGAGAVVDFLLPLFAGASMGLTPSQIGILVALELAVSLMLRPVAGSLADRAERRNVAALGALLYALSCAGYALAPGPSVAYIAAVIGGVGGSLLWVSVRALVGERLEEDSGVYARLMGAEETGEWVILVPALFLIAVVGYRGVFAALAVCCLIGMLILFEAPRTSDTAPGTSDTEAPGGLRPKKVRGRARLLGKLSPMLFAVALTMAAESAIGLLLLLHLQHEFGLSPLEIGMVFLPGGIVMGILPTYLHGVESRFGRSRVLALASVASTVFAVSLAFAPSPAVIGIAWVFTGAAWAVMLPVQQAVIAEVSGRQRLGRGLGWYESATLAGALVASIAAGYLYENGSWRLACLVAAAVILTGAVVVPAAVRALGVAEHPREPEPLEPEEDEEPDPEDEHDEEDHDDEAGPEEDEDEPESTRAELAAAFGWHTVILAGVLVVAHLFIDGAQFSQVFALPDVPPEPLRLDADPDWSQGYGTEIGELIRQWADQFGDWAADLGEWIGQEARIRGFASVLHIWLVVWVMDLISTLWNLPKAPRSHSAQQ